MVLVVNASSGFAGCTGAMQFGWLAPLIAASIIGGLAWVLLSQEYSVGENDAEHPGRRVSRVRSNRYGRVEDVSVLR